MNRSLSIPEWHRMARNGSAPPVRILLNGGSMQPLIRWNKDYVTIVPLEEPPCTGDIVLLCEPISEVYVVHRVWRTRDDAVLTWGDHLAKPDGWIPLEAVWGKVILIERGKKRFQPDPKKGILWARIWHQGGKVTRLYQRYKDGIARRINKRKV